MFTRSLVFAAAFGVATLAGAGGGTGATAAVAMTRIGQDADCVAACQATFEAEDARCFAADLAGGFRGGFYRPCVSYARYQYDNCVAACPA
ncbi:hypothetical protein [Brevundimonas sp.]|uniref:hypothetical protein n=1 Tax=Brevundimonas sp. TaxID=1871086 RepID=UPI0035AECBAB